MNMRSTCACAAVPSAVLHRRQALCAAALVVLYASVSGLAIATRGAGPLHLDERDLQAAFLFNLVKFVEWPPAADGPLVIGILGEDGLAMSLAHLVQGKSVRGRALHARRLAAADDPAGSHVLFIAATLQRHLRDIVQHSRAPVLTVGETPHFLRDGGHIRLFMDADRLRFQINVDAVERAGMKISSQLLSLAAR